MASSNFKVFAEAVAALNVVSDAEYATDTQRINGVVPGLASAALHNKLYKQATIMAAALAQVLVEQGQDALDSDYAALVASLKKSLVLSLNGEKPDKNGNIQKNFVYSVEGKTPDSKGNVALYIDYLNAMSFVGSVVITKENINPGTKIGGTWQLLQSGRYIRSAGDGYAGGALGGSDGFVLTQKNCLHIVMKLQFMVLAIISMISMSAIGKHTAAVVVQDIKLMSAAGAQLKRLEITRIKYPFNLPVTEKR